MAPSYKLTYFDGRGAAESIRYLFKYGNIESTTPFGQLPVLEHNGKKVNESIAINRYVGRLVNLAGNNEWENLEIDAVIDTLNDTKQKIGLILYEQDEERKKAQKEIFVNETIPFYFSRLDAIVQKNNGYLALGRLTWADFYFVASKPLGDSYRASLVGDVLNKYQNLKALTDKIHALPTIRKWVKERPKTAF